MHLYVISLYMLVMNNQNAYLLAIKNEKKKTTLTKKKKKPISLNT